MLHTITAFFSHPLGIALGALLIPVLLIPLFMRFLVAPFIGLANRGAFRRDMAKKGEFDWKQNEDREIWKQISQYISKRTSSSLVFRPDIQKDLLALIALSVQRPGNEKKIQDDHIIFDFSVNQLCEILLLGFSDIYRSFSKKLWFRPLRRLPLFWFFKAQKISQIFQPFLRHPLVQGLSKSRLAGKILRAILIPLLGIPALILYALRSIIISLAGESYIRLFYGFLLWRMGYYILYLYGAKNSHLTERIKNLTAQRITLAEKTIHQRLVPETWGKKSRHFYKAKEVYMNFLKQGRYKEDPRFFEKEKDFLQNTQNLFSSIWQSIKKSYNPVNNKELEAKPNKYLELFKSIASVYTGKEKDNWQYLRLGDALEGGYMISLFALHKIKSVPGLAPLLNQIRGKTVFQISQLASGLNIKDNLQSIRKAYPLYRLSRMAYRIFRVARGIVAPYSLILSFSAPILFNQAQKNIEEYLVHLSGRLSLYTWEKKALGKKPEMDPILF
ncbi:MAG: hypothetical protein JXR70_05330 [Spirochaetales bacterium]|nr:hypothetical protein [Spirochaetales bacterium]